MAKSDGRKYFRRASLFWIVVVTVSMGYFTCVVFAPEKVPFELLGPFGSFTKYLVDNHAGTLNKMWWAAWAVHGFEAVVALWLCNKRGISSTTTRCLWFVQTFLYGFASLSLLKQYKPERPKQQ